MASSRRRVLSAFAAAIVLASAVASAAPSPRQQSDIPDSMLDGPRWRLIGPFRAGWSTVAAGIADQPTRLLLRRRRRRRLEDDRFRRDLARRYSTARMPQTSARSRSRPAIRTSSTSAPASPTSRYDIAAGDGVYKSTDGGKTWQHVGLAATRYIGPIGSTRATRTRSWSPPSAMSSAPSAERGVFRSVDGGKTWTKTLVRRQCDRRRRPRRRSGQSGHRLRLDLAGALLAVAAATSCRSRARQRRLQSIDGGETWQARATGDGWPGGKLGRIGLAATHAQRRHASTQSSTPKAPAACTAPTTAAQLAVRQQRQGCRERLLRQPHRRRRTIPMSSISSASRCARCDRRRRDTARSSRARPAATTTTRCGSTRSIPIAWSSPATRAPRSASTAARTGATGTTSRPASSITSPPTTASRTGSTRASRTAARSAIASRSDYGALELPRLASGRRRRARLRHARSAGSGHRLRLRPRRPPVALGRAHRRGAEHLAVADCRATASARPTVKYRYTWITPIAISRKGAFPALSGRAGAVPLDRPGPQLEHDQPGPVGEVRRRRRTATAISRRRRRAIAATA